MPPRQGYAPGTFCLVDLTTPDVAAAADFYGRVFGWTTAEVPGQDFASFRRDGAVVAGLAPSSAESAAAGTPPVWSVWVAVEDVDAAAARAAELGAAVRSGPRDVPGAGRMAVIADPQGAVLVLWQAGPFAGAEVVNEPGAWSWNDLQTGDPAGAEAFYAGLFGWEISEVPGSGGVYRAIENGGRGIGGVMQAPPGVEHAVWMSYFGVESVGAALEQVAAAGGHRLAGPFDVPAGRFATVADATGAAFSLVEGRFDP